MKQKKGRIQGGEIGHPPPQKKREIKIIKNKKRERKKGRKIKKKREKDGRKGKKEREKIVNP